MKNPEHEWNKLNILYLVIHLEGILRHLIQSTIVVCHYVHGLIEYCEYFKDKIPIFFEHGLFSKVKWLYQVCSFVLLMVILPYFLFTMDSIYSLYIL